MIMTFSQSSHRGSSVSGGIGREALDATMNCGLSSGGEQEASDGAEQGGSTASVYLLCDLDE